LGMNLRQGKNEQGLHKKNITRVRKGWRRFAEKGILV
jgi:hypothetical protein